MVSDELKNMGDYSVLSFDEFLEAISRIADAKDLFTKVRLR